MVPEPPDTFGLWSAVKAKTGWPDTNEDTVRELARTWRGAGDSFNAAVYDTRETRAAWTDAAGVGFAGALAVANNDAARVGLSCHQQSNHAKAFATIVANTKLKINHTIMAAIPAYGLLTGIVVLPVLARRRFVQATAAIVNRIIRDAATAVEYLDSGVTVQNNTGDQSPFAECNNISVFILNEMNKNGNSAEVERIRRLLESSNPLDKARGLKEWYDLVKTGGPWDHKSRILGMTVGDNVFTPMPEGGEIRHDIWSNIHYGYAGTHAGIDGRVLHAGANGVDMVENLGVDKGDQAAVQIGIDLARQYPPGTLTQAAMDKEIMNRYGVLVAAGVIRPR
ncbi:putative secreted protein [Alloactinosynnema sp. L-07]|uniref:WXG100-like domain-containing protein n=1 Tax=Alloactinosynnema sp. L-07 TaxID=1653480 RepID=UPI00065EFDE1|nr:polymorphic toxin type 44 domain-containing protein [Alloactinosynnema sp. L-07]CRK59526.1 putative secreted protein [Alloactinosynnema sp. L-07]